MLHTFGSATFYGEFTVFGRERRPRRSEINNYSFIRTLPILSPTGSSFAKGAHAIGYCFVGLLRKGGGTA